MAGFSRQDKLAIIFALRRMRRAKRMKSESITFHDVEQVIWNLTPTRFARFISYINNKISQWQGKKFTKT